MILLLHSFGLKETRKAMTFAEMQAFVGGDIELLNLSMTDGRGKIIYKTMNSRTHRQAVQVLCNEEGTRLNLSFNTLVQRHFGSQLNCSANPGPGQFRPVGNWIVLSGKDKLK